MKSIKRDKKYAKDLFLIVQDRVLKNFRNGVDMPKDWAQNQYWDLLEDYGFSPEVGKHLSRMINHALDHGFKTTGV